MLAIAVAAGVAAVCLAGASAGPPPPLLVHVAVTHEQPVAGRLFTGLAFTPAGSARIAQVVCDARIGRAQLRGRQQRFHADGVNGPAAVTCGWLIPSATQGERLRLSGDEGRAWIFLVQPGGHPSTAGSPVLSWQIER